MDELFRSIINAVTQRIKEIVDEETRALDDFYRHFSEEPSHG